MYRVNNKKYLHVILCISTYFLHIFKTKHSEFSLKIKQIFSYAFKNCKKVHLHTHTHTLKIQTHIGVETVDF